MSVISINYFGTDPKSVNMHQAPIVPYYCTKCEENWSSHSRWMHIIHGRTEMDIGLKFLSTVKSYFESLHHLTDKQNIANPVNNIYLKLLQLWMLPSSK